MKIFRHRFSRFGGYANHHGRPCLQLVGDGDLNLCWQKIHGVFSAAINFGMPLLASVTLDLGDGHAVNADRVEGVTNFVELEGLMMAMTSFMISTPWSRPQSHNPDRQWPAPMAKSGPASVRYRRKGDRIKLVLLAYQQAVPSRLVMTGPVPAIPVVGHGFPKQVRGSSRAWHLSDSTAKTCSTTDVARAVDPPAPPTPPGSNPRHRWSRGQNRVRHAVRAFLGMKRIRRRGTDE